MSAHSGASGTSLKTAIEVSSTCHSAAAHGYKTATLRERPLYFFALLVTPDRTSPSMPLLATPLFGRKC
jgi:hypothetical protein